LNSHHDRSERGIRLVAGIIWFCGGLILLLKGSSLLLQAGALRPGVNWIWLAIPAGLLIGGIKTVLIFEKACRRNLDRIATLEHGRLWQAYRPRFYFFLILMITLAGVLSRQAQGHYAGLVAVAILDFSLATALLGSGRLFWLHRQEHRAKPDNKER